MSLQNEITIEQLKKENEALKRKLNDRDIPFNKNLLSRVDSKFLDMSFNVGQAIINSVDLNLRNKILNSKITVNYESSRYSRSGYYIRFCESKYENEFKDFMSELELKKFQESLDNFSWAVQNQGGQ